MAHDKAKIPEQFKTLLVWLDGDPDRAVERYFTIRKRLVKLFEVKGCPESDELADETIDRVLKKVESFSGSYEGDPAAYFYGVARNVFHEYLRRPRSEAISESIRAETDSDENTAERMDCLEKCLHELPLEHRTLIVSYYNFEKGQKAVARRSLAESLGVTLNYLRIRSFRIREALEICITGCVEGKV